MTDRFPPAPVFGAPLPATRPSQGARRLLALRKSANKLLLTEPGPNADELDELLTVAMRVPDHRKLAPWRFIVFEGSARQQAGEVLARLLAGRGSSPTHIDEAARSFQLAPVVVAVVSSPTDDGRTPVWEQELSCGAACFNLLLAANASGWAGVWLTGWAAYDTEVATLFGLAKHERFAGFIHLGTAKGVTPERVRPELSAKVTRWSQS